MKLVLCYEKYREFVKFQLNIIFEYKLNCLFHVNFRKLKKKTKRKSLKHFFQLQIQKCIKLNVTFNKK